jgi:hypothetical protein
MCLQEPRCAQAKIRAFIHVRHGVGAQDAPIRRDLESELIAIVEKLKGGLQQMIAIRSPAHDMQKEIQLCRGRPDVHVAILSTA